MISKRAVIALVAGSIALLATPPHGQAAGKDTAPDTKKAAAKTSTASASDEAAIRAHLSALAAAASSADATKMSSLWAEDATYVDEDGAQTKGRQALLKRFADGLAASGKTTVSISPTSIKLIGSEAAWVEGATKRQTALGLEPAVRFTMLLRKQNGAWVIASASETAIADKTAADHLNALDWIVGQWKAESGGNKVTMTAEWASNKNFIRCQFDVDKAGSERQLDSQIIGWDPTTERIVSWQFGANGGFGYANWTQRGKQWLVEADGIDQSGRRSSATNVLSLQGPDKFSWQSIGRSVNGVSVPDTETLTVERASK